MVKWVLGAILLLNFYAFAENPATGEIPLKPDPEFTVGDFCTERDRDFEGYRYKEKIAICYRDVSWERKNHVYTNYGIPRHCRHLYTVDHYIPLFMGGSNQAENLWPEHKDVKGTRQTLEQNLYDQLRNGKISQTQALDVITFAKQNPPSVIPRGCN